MTDWATLMTLGAVSGLVIGCILVGAGILLVWWRVKKL